MNNFEIQYQDENGEVIKIDKVTRVKRQQLKDLIILQQDLLYAFLKCNASVGSLISNNVNWNNMEKIAKMLPVVGETKLGINLKAIEDDLSQLTKVFFTQSIDENGSLINSEDAYKPSLISELHQLDYYGDIKESAKKIYRDRINEETVTL
jgi:hypothetical protein